MTMDLILRETARAVRAENIILRNHNYPYVGCVNDTQGHEASWKDYSKNPQKGNNSY